MSTQRWFRVRRGHAMAVCATALLAAVSLAACSSSSNGSGGATAPAGQTIGSAASGSGGATGSANTIKIGLLPPTTGNTAAFGQEMMKGWDLYWDQHNNKAGKYTIDSIHLDYGGDVSTAVTDANKLVTQDKVSMIVGALQANVSLAIIGPLAKAKVPYIDPVAASDDMTQRSRSPYFLRLAGSTSSQLTQPQGAYAISKGYKTVATICSDYAFGYESCGGFVNTFTDGGGKVLKQLWSPLGTTDFSSYITQVRQEKPDTVFVQLSGADGARFLKQWNSFGMKGTIPLMAGEALLDQTSLNGLTAADAEGLVSSGVWAGGLDNPPTKTFVKQYSAKYGTPPSFYAASMYIAAGAIAKGIEKLDGDVSNGIKLVKTLQSLDLGNTPMGPMTTDSYGDSVQNVYMRKTEVVNGKLVNKVIKTYPKVTQFWTYNVKEFLNHPAYSKTYQGNGVWPNPEK